MNGTSQKGLSLISVLIVGVLAAFLLLMGFRCMPAITEFMAIERLIRTVAEEGNGGMPVSEMRNSFIRRSHIADITSVTGADLEISTGGGKTTITVEYPRKVPIAGNVSLLIDFRATTGAAY